MNAVTTSTLLAPTQALATGTVFVPPAAADAAAKRASMQVRQGFRVGGIGLMVRDEDGSELTEIPAVHRLPNAPAWLRGICNLHGLLVPVFDLASYAGLAAQAPERPMLLVLSHGPDAAGVLIDGMPQRLRFDAAQAVDILAAPAALVPLLRGAALLGTHLWFDLDRPALLDALENSLKTP
jgi:twitching motility protein PilI